ncbi:pentatricopeptide repeat-containing protein At2g22410, mitochondrial [Rutidosis leptorrhynchoides]|uniref:pentatricopeptide repeat-containing protein At2g22410, mitochondrial n=1 Tax=Rutidosis leptorrhynchoides TaxID=125765 RepID=UPI003A996793
MIVSNLRFRCCTHKPRTYLIHMLSFQTRSLSPYQNEPKNWNTTHTFILSNPLLILLEKCKSMTQLKQIQARMIVTGLISDGLAASRLIAFCAISDSRDLDYCKMILNNLRNTNVFSWNVMIRGYCEIEKPEESVFLYREMLRRGNGLRPDNHTYPLLLKCCSKLSLTWMGLAVIGHVICLGFGSDLYVNNAVIHLLVSCGRLVDAHKVFDESSVRDLVAWNSIINGYVKSGKPSEALRLYERMLADGIKPDEVTMIGVVSSCAQLENLNFGREFHRYIEENQVKVTVPLGNALMDMYMKCGDMDNARNLFDKMVKKSIVSWTIMVVGYGRYGCMDVAKKLFDKMPERNVVSCNAMIGGYIQAERYKDALALFHAMQDMKIKPDEVTMVYCLSACSQLGALDFGIWIHHYITKHNLNVNVGLGTTLVDMYAKCGNMKKALQVFDEMPSRNSLTWTVIINGLAKHGKSHKAILYFWEMVNVGLTPDEITFLGVLSACCHSGLVNEGRKIFSQMSTRFNVLLENKHYSCMIDLLGRAGLLEEAEELIKSMPTKPDEIVWGALFFACRVHMNVEMGERAAFKLLELDPGDGGTYVLLANMYWEAKMFDKAREVRKLMRSQRVDKTPGCSSIEVNGNVYEFIVRDKSHPQYCEVNECLIHLAKQLEVFEDIHLNSLLASII